MTPISHAPPYTQSGFTLIELMATLAILMILAALAYPGYTSYVVKARRAEAQAALLELMQQQERHYTRHNTYLAFSAESSEPEAQRLRWWSGSHAARSGYELHGEACENETIEQCIVLKAVPGTERVDASFRDADCGALALDSVGRRTSDGPLIACWP